VQKTLGDFIGGLRAQQANEAGVPGFLQRWVRKDTRDAQWEWLGKRATLLGNCLIALTKGMKLKFGVPGLGELEFNPAEAQAEVQAQIERADRPATAHKSDTPSLESLYYDLHSYLQELTRGEEEDSPKLNFIFLIDDLDRCLPDKAVEMLEAIKLFLDVQGCAFLLALDDEVIERGIAHRYRDYLDQTDRTSESIAYSLNPERYGQYVNRVSGRKLPPITGHEYLEKIVQLPFRLPRWSETEARAFLVKRFGTLFENATTKDETDPTARAKQDERRWRLDLFARAVPPIPRKLIRAAELIEFVTGVAQGRGLQRQLEPYTLAQLTLLQLFAPQLYRFLRRGHLQGWLTLDKRLRGEPASYEPLDADGAALAPIPRPDPRGASFFDWWEGLCQSERQSNPDDAWYIDNVEQPLIAELRQASANRGGFDPRNLFLHDRRELRVDQKLERYFSLFADLKLLDPTEPAEERPVGSPRDRGQFVSQLRSSTAESWHTAFERERDALAGKVLDGETFDELLRAIGNPPPAHVGADWLDVVAPALTPLQLKRLIAESGLLGSLASSAGVDALVVPRPSVAAPSTAMA
jgi:hypothetical protein